MGAARPPPGFRHAVVSVRGDGAAGVRRVCKGFCLGGGAPDRLRRYKIGRVSHMGMGCGRWVVRRRPLAWREGGRALSAADEQRPWRWRRAGSPSATRALLRRSDGERAIRGVGGLGVRWTEASGLNDGTDTGCVR